MMLCHSPLYPIYACPIWNMSLANLCILGAENERGYTKEFFSIEIIIYFNKIHSFWYSHYVSSFFRLPIRHLIK